MITIKEAAKIVKEKEPKASFFDAIDYRNLYVFHMYDGDVWTPGSTLDYHMSVDKNTGKADYFSYWDAVADDPDVFAIGTEHTYSPNEFLD